MQTKCFMVDFLYKVKLDSESELDTDFHGIFDEQLKNTSPNELLRLNLLGNSQIVNLTE